MSEKEKQQRYNYQQRRKKWIVLQTALVLFVSVALIFTGLSYVKASKESYVTYTEQGNVIYKAYLADNEFYSEEYLNGSHAYVASLIEKMTADFTYETVMASEDVKYDYFYKIDAQLIIKDKETKMAIYNPVYELLPIKKAVAYGSKLSVKDSVEIDYNEYNKTAKSFVTTYGLNDTEALLSVKMYVDILGESKEFAENNKNSYVTELCIPLLKPTVSPYVITPDTTEEQKVLAVNTKNLKTSKGILLAVGILDIFAIIILVVFTFVTRDKHIDYSIKVKRLITSYKSYIQKINNPLNMSDYQILNVDTFIEMLEIRDTIQKPILMYENEDKTCSDFFIVTDSDLLYLYRLSVNDDYKPFGKAKESQSYAFIGD